MTLFQEIKLEVESYRDYILTSDPFMSSLANGTATALHLKYFLENIRYLVEHTPKHLMRAIKISEKRGKPQLAAFFRHKMDEESGHDKWAEDDLKIVASMSRTPLPRVSIDPRMESLLEHLEATIDEDPTLYLAYILFTEYLAVLIGPDLVRNMEDKCGFPKRSLTVIENHAELDKEHVSEWKAVYEDFVHEETYRAAFLDTVKKSIRIHKQFMANCAGDPRSKTLTFTIDPLLGLGEWTVDGTVFQGVQRIGELDVYYSGMKATHPELGEAIGADASVGQPGNGAWFELLERMSILEARKKSAYILRGPGNDEQGLLTKRQVFLSDEGHEDEYRYSLSNGVAIQSSWEAATESAAFELIERHVILESWAGGPAPQLVQPKYESQLGKLEGVYDASRYLFQSVRIACFEERVQVAMTVLKPREAGNPLVFAFGASLGADAALQKSEKEAIQRLVFLWGEELPDREPAFAPSNIYHQEFFLYPGSHDRFEAWLNGDYVAREVEDRELDITFADMTMFSSLPLYVAKAISKDAIPLVFGRWRENETFRSLPDDRLIHPVA